MSSVKNPRIGVVGVGALGFHHARILSTLADVTCAGVYDADRDRAGAVAGELGLARFGSLADLLDQADAVVVAVPTSDHESVACEALSRGLPVLVEKPLAPTLEAADNILAAAAESGTFVQTGHVERFNPAILAAEEYLDAPLFIESHRMAPFTPRSTDVAVVLDLMIHDVDLVMSLVGTPLEELAASGVPVLTPNVDIANARLSFRGGAVANLTASRVSLERMRKLRIFQRSGYISLDLAAGTGSFLRLKGELPGPGSLPSEGLSVQDLAEIVERVPLAGDGVEPLVRELENFRDAVGGKAPPAVTGAEGRSALAVSLAIQERIEGHVVDTGST